MSPTETSTDAETDADASIFDAESDTEVTRWDRYMRWLETWLFASARIAWSDWRVRIGSLIVLLYILMGTVGVVLVPEPTIGAGPRYVGPFTDWQFPLGTDNLGRGILGQIVHATPFMLQMIASGAVFAIAVATAVGTLSGYKRGTVDQVLMTITDIAMTIPGLPLVIVLSVLLQPKSPIVIGIVLTINAWAGLARSIRSQVLTIREESYIEASRTIGVPTSTIIREDILPNLMPYVVVNFVQAARNVIFSSVGLYFLGLLPTSKPNWGVMMSRAYSTAGALYTWDTAYWLIFPMITIILLVFGLILFAQGTDRLFNPRVRARHAGGGPSKSSGDADADSGETKGMF
ncbi:ABC transporter permease (plasmid) [Halarchaeum sp. CBA1220]|uniref:ABC transporter permease n=1 Tax=Halarchaeum sp. CBA1220 TaxID=1853682 RepID=UPI000F3A8F77|nr:ABC transporter permease [Halarchaeum sp. CBA1220]QLC34779.1 ABC transporter permease [Halarchaeum sp. CBA1220]